VTVPLVDLRAQYASIRDEIDETLRDVAAAGEFILGHAVDAFQAEFAAYCGARHAVGVSNGTDAIMLALRAAGIGAGDEVITVPNTFIATTEAIAMAGARARFVDVDERTLTMDPEALARGITPRTRAVIPVHLYGQPADMAAILEVAGRHGLTVIEDAAQAHGAEYRGRRVGTFGRAATFSFYPGKNLGAYGDAGAVVTDDPEVAERVAMLRNHGRREKYLHDVEGFSCRLDALQAAVLRVKLRYLEKWTASRQSVARAYAEHLRGLADVALPVVPPDVRHVFHLFVVRVPARDRVLAALKSRGVQGGVHYPVPLHLQPAYAGLGLGRGSFPRAERAADSILSLPMYPELADEQVRSVAAALAAALQEAGA
jgi:dTDP-4-amino-4,6-dideoxygalactose transaminase